MKNNLRSFYLSPEERIILALDGMTSEEAISFASGLKGLKWVKVGLELFVEGGPEIIFRLKEYGLNIFLDLKFHDIPATMRGVCYRAGSLGVEMISVHACAGSKALLEAQSAAVKGSSDVGLPAPKLLGVTVLTSWDSRLMEKELKISQPILDRVNDLAFLAKVSGLSGCVCSPLEVKTLRIKHPLPFELITPGIRLPGDDLSDQARVMSPLQALIEGSSRIVIGRSITLANDPLEAFNLCCTELKKI